MCGSHQTLAQESKALLSKLAFSPVSATGWASLKPEIIRRIEQEEELHVGEFWKPFKWKMPRSPWLGKPFRPSGNGRLLSRGEGS